ncbi:MAG: hypothetical protein J5J06_16855 [Phycisphaerae bacterium]|nr:hypothetical protein [Phycisphaerae bacterium]
MRTTAVILAAHGSYAEPAVNAQISDWAGQLRHRGVAREVLAAFHQGSPQFREVLDGIGGEAGVVVPVMTSEGFFASEFLPAELARNGRFGSMDVRITRPVGTHRDVVSLIADRAGQMASAFDIRLSEAVIALVGHGTPRHRASRRATESAAQLLGEGQRCNEVITAFIDDEPAISSVLGRTEGRDVIAIPFLIGAGPHAVQDVPAALGLPSEPGAVPPFSGLVGGRQVVCDAPIGTHPGILGIIESLVREGIDAPVMRGAEPHAV